MAQDTRERLPDFFSDTYERDRLIALREVVERRLDLLDDAITDINLRSTGVVGGEVFAPIVHTHGLSEITDFPGDNVTFDPNPGHVSITGDVTFGDLSDVDLTGVNPNYVPIWTGSGWVTTNIQQFGGTLVSLTDTSIVNPVDGAILLYNDSLQVWEDADTDTLPYVLKAGDTMLGDLKFESESIRMGAGDLAQFVHDGNLRLINDTFGGNFQLLVNTIDLAFNATPGGPARLYHSGNERWTTLTDGVQMTDGTDTATLDYTAGQLRLASSATSGVVEIYAADAGDVQRALFVGDPDAESTMYFNAVATARTQADDFQVWDGSGWQSVLRTDSSLDDLADVDLTGAADNDMLFRSGGNWIDTAGNVTWDGSFLEALGTISGDPGTEGGSIQINNTAYEASAKVSDIGGANEAQLLVHRHSTTLPAVILGTRASDDTSSHSVVADNDILLALLAAGWDGVDTYSLSSEIRFEVDGTPGDNDMPGQLTFMTAADGTQVPLERMRIRADGNVEIDNDLTITGNLIGVGGGNTGIGQYTYESTTTAPPLTGEVRFNNASVASATEMYVFDTNADSVDVSNFLALLDDGAVVFINARDDRDKWVAVELSSATDNTTYWTFGIASIDVGPTALVDADPIDYLFAPVGAGGGGASALDDLTDVTISGVATGDMFYKSAGDWLNTSQLSWDESTSTLTLTDTAGQDTGIAFVEDATQEALLYWDAGLDAFYMDLDGDDDFVIRNQIGTTPEIQAIFGQGGFGQQVLYNAGSWSFNTATHGADFRGSSANVPSAGGNQSTYINLENSVGTRAGFLGYFNSADMELHNEVHGAHMILSGELDAGGPVDFAEWQDDLLYFRLGGATSRDFFVGRRTGGTAFARFYSDSTGDPGVVGETNYGQFGYANNTGQLQWRLGISSSTDLYLTNQHREGEIRLQSNNTAGTAHDMAYFDPIGAVSLFYNNLLAAETAPTGFDVYDTSGSDPLLNLRTDAGTLVGSIQVLTTQMEIKNLVNAQDIVMSGNNTGGAERALFLGDPDAEVRLYHPGSNTVSLDTTTDGVKVYKTILELDNSAATETQIRAYNSEGGVALLTDGGNAEIVNTDSAGAELEQYIEMVAGSHVILYHNDVDVFRTLTDGIRAIGTSSNNPTSNPGGTQTGQIQMTNASLFPTFFIGHSASAELFMKNEVHGGDIVFRSDTAAGTLTDLLTLDPDAGPDGAVILGDNPGTAVLNPDQRKITTAVTTINNTTTLTDITGLTAFTMETDTWYTFEMSIDVVAASATPDLDITLTFTNTPQANRGVYSFVDNTTGRVTDDYTFFTSLMPVGLGTPAGVIYAIGAIHSNATTGGTFDIQIAQQTADASDSTAREGSWARIEKMNQ